MKTHNEKLTELQQASADLKTSNAQTSADVDAKIAAARYATTPAPKLDRRDMMFGTNSIIEPDHREMIERLRAVAAAATLHQQVSIDEAELRQLLSWADEAVFA